MENRSRIDLHVHSIHSDGLFSPEALCQMADQKDLTHLALCDHDTLAGLLPMARAVRGLNRLREREGKPGRLVFVPGVELSCGPDGQTHLLGYGASAENPLLAAALAQAALRRKERFGEMRQKLAGLGCHVPQALLPGAETLERGFPLGRAHLARALVQTGGARTVAEAFDRYLAEGRPAYVPYDHLSALAAANLLKRAGAVPVLAHPKRMKLELSALTGLLQSLREAGLMGLEVYHPSATRRDIRAFEPLARRLGLLVTGGSDFHGDAGSGVQMGKLPGGWLSAPRDMDRLMEYIRGA